MIDEDPLFLPQIYIKNFHSQISPYFLYFPVEYQVHEMGEK